MDEIVSPVFRDQGGRLFALPALLALGAALIAVGGAEPLSGTAWMALIACALLSAILSILSGLRLAATVGRDLRALAEGIGSSTRGEADLVTAARPLAGGDRLGRARIQCLHRQAARHSDAHQRDRRAERGGKRRARLRGRGTVRDDDPDGRVHGIAQDQRGPAADRHGRIRGRTVGHTRGGRLGRRQDQGPVRGPRRLGGGPGLHFRGGRFGREAAPRAAGRRRVPGEGRGRERQGPGRGQRGAQGHSLLRRRRARHGRRDRGRQREDQPARHERGHRGGAGGRAGKGLRGGRGGDPQARRVDRQQCPVDPLVHRGGGRPRGRGLLARRALRAAPSPRWLQASAR